MACYNTNTNTNTACTACDTYSTTTIANPPYFTGLAIGQGSLTEKKIFIGKDFFKNYKIPGSIKYIDFKHNGEAKEVYIREVLYSPPATIVFWSDNTKTSSKADAMDTYNPYTGLVLCVLKKMYGGDEVAALIDAWGPNIFELARLYEVKEKKKPLRKTLTEIRRILRLKDKTKKDGDKI